MSLPDTPSAPPNAQVPKRKKSRLTLYIGIAIVAAVGLAVTAPQVAVQFELGGEIFLRLLLMMVVPLVDTVQSSARSASNAETICSVCSRAWRPRRPWYARPWISAGYSSVERWA